MLWGKSFSVIIYARLSIETFAGQLYNKIEMKSMEKGSAP